MPPQYPKQGMNKGLLWGLIGGGVALVLLIIGVVVFFVFFGPRQAEMIMQRRIIKLLALMLVLFER